MIFGLKSQPICLQAFSVFLLAAWSKMALKDRSLDLVTGNVDYSENVLRMEHYLMVRNFP